MHGDSSEMTLLERYQHWGFVLTLLGIAGLLAALGYLHSLDLLVC